MKHMVRLIMVMLLIFGTAIAQAQIYLDADTQPTGSDLESNPLVTQYGTITFSGEIGSSSDPDTVAAGSSGNMFDGVGVNPAVASLFFDFDVCSFQFVYGGNGGNITIEALDNSSNVINSFTQADTANQQPAGPIILLADGTRELYWFDTAGGYAYLDNIEITVCAPVAPVPTLSSIAIISLILAMGIFGFGVIRRYY